MFFFAPPSHSLCWWSWSTFLHLHLYLMVPFTLHWTFNAPNKRIQYFFLTKKLWIRLLFDWLPILLHPFKKVLCWNNIFLIPIVWKECWFKSIQVNRKSYANLIILMKHEPYHHQFSIEVLSRPHNLHFFTFFKPNLVQVKNLRHKVACNLPWRIPMKKITNICV